MHRPTIIRHDHGTAPIPFSQFKKVGLTGKVPAALRQAANPLGLRCRPRQDDSLLWQLPDQFRKLVIPPQFRWPARGSMDRQIALRPLSRCQTQGKLNRTRCSPEMNRRPEVPVDSMNPRNGNDFVMKKAGTFAGITQADPPGGAGQRGQQTAAQQTLQVHNEIIAPPPEAPDQLGQTAVLMPWKGDDFVDDRAVFQQGNKRGIHQPRQVGLRVSLPDLVDSRESVNNVAEAAGFEDQDARAA